MHGFKRVRGGVETSGDEFEFSLISSLMRDVAAVLGEDIDEIDPDDPLAALERELEPATSERSDDPALSRLLPDMSEDPEVADELRRLTESGIRAAKVDRCSTVYRALKDHSGTVFVAEADVPTWLSALNDLRLVLATRLDITDQERSEEVAERAMHLSQRSAPQAEATDEEELENQLMLVYAMVSWWQDSLVEAVSFSRPRG